MGFSVSGSAAIVFVGLFIAFGTFHTASANSFEQVTEAQGDHADDVLDTQNTDVDIVTASYDGTNDELTVEVNNTGATQLRVSTTDLLVDGRYQNGWASGATVADDGATDLWLAGEQLSVTLADVTSQPDRVKVVTATGVEATAEVTAP